MLALINSRLEIHKMNSLYKKHDNIYVKMKKIGFLELSDENSINFNNEMMIKKLYIEI